MAKTYKTSETGFYEVKLSKTFERRDFLYKPGRRIRVSQAVLDEMIAEDAVDHVTPV